MSSNQNRRPSKKEEEGKQRWFFTAEEIATTPSMHDGIPRYDELRYRQNAANLIQECGKSLSLLQLPINTAIVFLHRFFMVHSFKKFNKYDIAAAALFLASKVEENPRKVEAVLKVKEDWTRRGNEDQRPLDPSSEEYQRKLNLLIDHELLMLQTFGFDVSIDHPHKHVIKATQFMRAPRELSHVAYFMATNSLNLTTFCLEMRPEVVAATCIYLSIKWSKFHMGPSDEGRQWWTYLAPNLTEDVLNSNVKRYLDVLKDHPTRVTEIKNLCPGSTHNIDAIDHRGSSNGNSNESNGRQADHHRSSSHTTQKRPNPTDDHETAKRIKTEPRIKEEPKPTLPPVRPPNCVRNRDLEIKQRLEPENNSDRAKMPSNQNTSSSNAPTRPGSYLPKLKKDFVFVKECLRRKDLWCKLSDEEKDYCKKAKDKMRRDRDRIRQQHESRRSNHVPSSTVSHIRAPPDLSESHSAVDQIANELRL